jgi:SAM-dependent methyltransferase
MSQNIYDNDDFFAGYSKLRRSVEGLAGAPEWPVLRDWLGDVRGAAVLDLGCGFGWACRWARSAGAASVLGIDLSENMLTRARETTPDGAVTYARADLEEAPIAAGAWDVIYSSLALHYVAGLAGLFGRVHAGLRPGGRFVFSVEHPIFTAPSHPGWQETHGRRVWPVDQYLDEGPRTTNWLAPGVVKQHRTVGSYVTLLLDAGFRLDHLAEWGPTEAQIAANPAWRVERDRPPFLLVAASRGK